MSIITKAPDVVYLGNNNMIVTGLSIGDITITDTDTLAFISANGTQSYGEIFAINYLVSGLKTNNLWDKMIGIYPFIGKSGNEHSINLKSPGTFNLTYAIPTGINFQRRGPYCITSNISTGINFTTGGRSVYDIHVSCYYSYNTNTISANLTQNLYGVTNGTYIFSAGTSSSPNNKMEVFTGDTAGRVFINHGLNGGTHISNLFVCSSRISSSNAHGRVNTVTGTDAVTRTLTGINTDIKLGGSYYFGIGNNPMGYLTNIGCATVGTGLTIAESGTLNTLIQTFGSLLKRDI